MSSLPPQEFICQVDQNTHASQPGHPLFLLAADDRLLNYPLILTDSYSPFANTSVLSTCASTMNLVTWFLDVWECTQGFTPATLFRFMPPNSHLAPHFLLTPRKDPLQRALLIIFLMKFSSFSLKGGMVFSLCSVPKLEASPCKPRVNYQAYNFKATISKLCVLRQVTSLF